MNNYVISNKVITTGINATNVNANSNLTYDGTTLTITGGGVTAPTFTGNVTGNCSGSSGSCTGNAAGLTGAPNIVVGTISNTSTTNNVIGGITLSNSYLGVGCNTPAFPLDVNGSAVVRTYFGACGNGKTPLYISGTTPTPVSGLVLSWNTIRSGQGNAEICVGRGGGNGNLDIYTGVIDSNIPDASNLTMTIAKGNVGINCNAPGYTLDVSGTSHFTGNMSINTTSNTDNLSVYGSMYLYNNNINGGVLTFGNTSASPGSTYFSMHSNTNFYCVNASNGTYVAKGGSSWTTGSDSRMKTVLSNITNATEMLSSITPVYYTYNTDPDKKRHVGVIAQEVLPTFPEIVVVNSDPNEMMGLDYSSFVAPLITAVKELSARLSNVEARLAATTTS